MVENNTNEQIDAIVLAGGLGLRLQSILPEQQKVMASVNGVPFICYVIDWLKSYGIKRVILALGYKAEETRDSIQQFYINDEIEIVPSIENMPLGTAGAIRNALRLVHSNDVLIVNGDSFVNLDINRMYKFHQQKHATITISSAETKDPSRYGLVEFDSSFLVSSFSEKTNIEYNNSGKLKCFINSGVYIIDKAVIHKLPENKKISLETEVFPEYVHNKFYAFTEKHEFIDIGTPESLKFAETNNILYLA